MAKILSGEKSLTLQDKTYRLRLDIASMMALEAYSDSPIIQLVQEAGRGHLGCLTSLFLAMTAGDLYDKIAREKAAEILVESGLVPAMEGIIACALASLRLGTGASLD